MKREESLTVIKHKKTIPLARAEEIALEDIVILAPDPTQEQQTEHEIARFHRLLEEKQQEFSSAQENFKDKQKELISFALEMAKTYRGDFIAEFTKDLGTRGLGKIIENWDGSEKHIRKGQRCFYAKDYENAIKHYQNAVELYGFDIRALDGIGKSYLKINRPKEALEPYELILKHKPDSILAKINKGKILGELGKFREGIEILRDVLMVEKYNVTALVERAEVIRKYAITKLMRWDKEKLLSDALDHAESAIKIEPLCARAWYVQGEIYYSMNRKKDAFRCFAAYERLLGINDG